MNVVLEREEDEEEEEYDVSEKSLQRRELTRLQQFEEENEEDEEYQSRVSEKNLQRRELTRLLGTAKDEERQEFIRKAIIALNDANTSPGKKSIANRVHSLYQHNQVKFTTQLVN